MKAKYHAKCKCCNRVINEGFLIHDGEEYYCGENCLFTHYTREEYAQMYKNDEAFWTTWESQDEMFYDENGKEVKA